MQNKTGHKIIQLAYKIFIGAVIFIVLALAIVAFLLAGSLM